MPFARNAATEFISPTKTPEYLAAGVPVVSTSIHDVVRPYGERALVRIADRADDFEAACEAALAERGQRPGVSARPTPTLFWLDSRGSRPGARWSALMNEASTRKLVGIEAADD